MRELLRSTWARVKPWVTFGAGYWLEDMRIAWAFVRAEPMAALLFFLTVYAALSLCSGIVDAARSHRRADMLGFMTWVDSRVTCPPEPLRVCRD